eukprot:EG_transcript_21722
MGLKGKIFFEPLGEDEKKRPRMPKRGDAVVKVTFIYKKASSQVSFYHKTDVSGPISCKALRARYGLQCIDHLTVRMLYNRLTRTYDASIIFGDLPDLTHLCKRFLQQRYCYAQTCFKVHLDPSQQLQDEIDDMEPQPESGSDKVDDGSSGSSTDLEASADGGSSDRSGGEEEVRRKRQAGCQEPLQDEGPAASDDESSSQDSEEHLASISKHSRTHTLPRTNPIGSFWAAGSAPPPGGWAGKGKGRGKGKGKRTR